MITSIDETEVERLLETTEKLLDAYKKNNALSKQELTNIEDQTYYFRKALKRKDFSFEHMVVLDNDDDDNDDDDDYDDDEYEEDDV